MVSYKKTSDRLPRLTASQGLRSGRRPLNGKDVYCGPFGTAECRGRYLRAIADWEAAGRQLVNVAANDPPDGPSDLTINEMMVAYLAIRRLLLRQERPPHVGAGEHPAGHHGPSASSTVRPSPASSDRCN